MIHWPTADIVALLLNAFNLCLIGLDLKISSMRWEQGSHDLNPIVEHFRRVNVRVGLLALCANNLLVLAAANLYQPLLWMLAGSKLSLANLQLRSLINVNCNEQ